MKYFLIGLIAYLGYFFFPTDTPIIVDFIQTLSPDQKKLAVLDWEDEKRVDWHFLPALSYPRAGIQLSDLNDKQKELVHDLLKSALSEVGYEKVEAIIDLENILARLENNYTHRDPDQYALAIFGNPAEDMQWSWSFGGHHISLHFTYVDGKASFSPRFFGANPGEVKDGDKKGLRVLAQEEDLGFKLLTSLNSKQQEQAIISEDPIYEIVTKNQKQVDPLAAHGIHENELTEEQQIILDEILAVYLSCLPRDLAEKRMAIIQAEKKIFAWAGATVYGKAHYYRIQGKSFLIEFDNAQNNANHVHTVWRDFNGDFGRDLIREHREAHKH